MTMNNRERMRALWRSKSRATQRLIDLHRDEYDQIRDEELLKEGQPPIGQYYQERRTLEEQPTTIN